MPRGAYQLSDAKPIGAYSLSDVQPETAQEPPSEWARGFGRAVFGSLADAINPSLIDTVGHGVIGMLKGAGHTATNIGRLWDLAAGGRNAPMFDAADKELAPKGTAETAGNAAEQAAEFLIPSGVAERGAAAVTAKFAPKFTNSPRLIRAAARVAPRMATEAASAAAVSTAQGGNPLAAGVIGATGPVVSGALGAVAPKLSESAEKGVEQFLGATKERYKAMAQRITPQILKRGIRGSRESVMEQASQAADLAGQQIDDALQQFGARKVNASAVSQALESAKDAFRTTRELTPIEAVREGFAKVENGRLNLSNATMSADGMVQVPIVIEPRAVRQIDGLQNLINRLGPSPSVEQMVAVRRAWDSVVDQAGGFAHRAPGAIGMPLRDTTEAWAKREGANAIRRMLDQDVPELSALNKEYSFWKSLDDVLTQTTQRTGPQGPGLTREIAGAASAAAGSSHGLGPALVLQKLGKMANAVFTSPRWRLASAQMKDQLAWAIMQGRASEAAGILARISAGGASQAAGPTGGAR